MPCCSAYRPVFSVPRAAMRACGANCSVAAVSPKAMAACCWRSAGCIRKSGIAPCWKAFARAREKRPMGLVIVGDGLRRKAVEAQATRIGHVHMAGAVTDRDRLADIYASADLCWCMGSGRRPMVCCRCRSHAVGLGRRRSGQRWRSRPGVPHGASRVYRAGDAAVLAAPPSWTCLGKQRPFPPPTGIGSPR